MAEQLKTDLGRLVYIARESGATALNGVPVSITAGETIVEEGSDLYVGREHMFRPLVVHYGHVGKKAKAAPKIEQATAAPGELRNR